MRKVKGAGGPRAHRARMPSGKAVKAPEWNIFERDTHAALDPGGLTTVEARNWRGTFERFTFGPGFHVHFGTLQVERPSELAVSGQGGIAPIALFCTAMGQGWIKFPDRAPVQFTD